MKLAHASERAAERMGVAVSIDDLKEMAEKIRRGEGQRLNDRRDGGQCWCVTHKGKAFRVVYLPDAHMIPTVLPPLGVHKNHRSRREP